MLVLNRGQCENPNAVPAGDSDQPFAWQICDNTISVPSGFITDLPYESDGITPNFDGLFAALAEQERNAPPPDQL